MWKKLFYTSVAAFLPLVVFKPIQFSADIYVLVVTLQETSLSSYKDPTKETKFLHIF